MSTTTAHFKYLNGGTVYVRTTSKYQAIAEVNAVNSASLNSGLGKQLCVMTFKKDAKQINMIVTSMNENVAEGFDEQNVHYVKNIKSLEQLHFVRLGVEGRLFKHNGVIFTRYHSWDDPVEESTDMNILAPDIMQICTRDSLDVNTIFSPKALEAIKRNRYWKRTPLSIDEPLLEHVMLRFEAIHTLRNCPTLANVAVYQCEWSKKFYISSEMQVYGGRRISVEYLRDVGVDQRCGLCGKLETAHILDELDNEFYCAECLASKPRCAKCSTLAVKTMDGISLCDKHAKYRVVNDYHSNTSRDDPTFIGEHADEHFPLYLGVELEIDHNPESSATCYAGFASELARKYLDEENVEYTRDGSLSDKGIEMISQPKTITAWHESREAWANTFKALIKCNMRGHDAVGAGMHVHVSKDAFEEPSKAFVRLQVILHRHFNNLLKITRRAKSRMMNYAMPLSGLENIPKFTEKHISILRQISSFTVNSHSMLANDGSIPTFEFRMFRSTLNIESFMATIDFVEGLCRYVNTHDFNAANSITWEELKLFINSEDFNRYEERIMKYEVKPNGEASHLGVEKEEEPTTNLTAEAMIGRTRVTVASSTNLDFLAS